MFNLYKELAELTLRSDGVNDNRQSGTLLIIMVRVLAKQPQGDLSLESIHFM
jgi:hypothetical protein